MNYLEDENMDLLKDAHIRLDTEVFAPAAARGRACLPAGTVAATRGATAGRLPSGSRPHRSMNRPAPRRLPDTETLLTPAGPPGNKIRNTSDRLSVSRVRTVKDLLSPYIDRNWRYSNPRRPPSVIRQRMTDDDQEPPGQMGVRSQKVQVRTTGSAQLCPLLLKRKRSAYAKPSANTSSVVTAELR
jgi:hypothetical protein